MVEIKGLADVCSGIAACRSVEEYYRCLNIFSVSVQDSSTCWWMIKKIIKKCCYIFFFHFNLVPFPQQYIHKINGLKNGFGLYY